MMMIAADMPAPGRPRRAAANGGLRRASQAAAAGTEPETRDAGWAAFKVTVQVQRAGHHDSKWSRSGTE